MFASVIAEADLSWWQAILLGLIEGLTEYLPVSSTGHLLVAADLLGLRDTVESTEAIETFAICVQIGAIFAVLLLYWSRLRQMIDGLLGRSAEGRQILIAVLTAFLPTAIIGVTLFDIVRERFFGVGPIAGAWLVGGIIVLILSRTDWFDRASGELTELTLGKAALVGVAQALAAWPGVSRSLITIVACVAVGLKLSAAVEFSFLLGLITLSAATVFEGLKSGDEMIETFGYVTPLIGLIVGFVSAVAAVRWMVTWLNERGFEVFGWYRIAIGIAALGLLASGVIG